MCRLRGVRHPCARRECWEHDISPCSGSAVARRVTVRVLQSGPRPAGSMNMDVLYVAAGALLAACVLCALCRRCCRRSRSSGAVLAPPAGTSVVVAPMYPAAAAYPTAAHYPTTAAPYPTTAAPYPTGGAPYPTGGAPYPTSGAPYPTSGAPYPTSAYPAAGSPYPQPVAGQYPAAPSAPDVNACPPSYDQVMRGELAKQPPYNPSAPH